MNKTLLIIALILSGFYKFSFAQDFPYGAVTHEDLVMKRYDKDVSAHAVVLQEYGKTQINLLRSAGDKMGLIYEYHIKIKIFDTQALDKGTLQIPLYKDRDNDAYEDVDGITGVTYNLDDAGNIQTSASQVKKIYPENVNKHWAICKFDMPGIKKGCVVEYKYTIQSPYFDNFHTWYFQSDIPKIYSEHEVHIPQYWVYYATLKGPLKLTKSSATVESKCYDMNGYTCDCSVLISGMADIPAFIEEDYMTSPKNFKSAQRFELVESPIPYHPGFRQILRKDWKDIDNNLKDNNDFGGQIKRQGLFTDRLTAVLGGQTTDLSKAKAVYFYIQQLFKWNEHFGIYSTDGLSKAIDSRSGSVADINLALTAALNAAGLNASAVLLSTRDNGVVNSLYPVTDDFDYVIARVTIGDRNYLLDATDPLLAFGMLPLRCLNDKGRVINLDKPSFWIDLKLPQRETTTHSFEFTLQNDGKIKGTIVNYYGGYKAYKRRKEIKKFYNTEEYFEDLNAKPAKFKITKAEITNLDSLYLPLEEKYEVEMTGYDAAKDRVAFNPVLLDKIETNPFKLTERFYPVDFGMASDERYILTIHLPATYTIELIPKTIDMALPDNGGKFIINYDYTDNAFTFSQIIQFNKPIYSPEEYPFLKEFLNKVIQSEMTEIFFKKKA